MVAARSDGGKTRRRRLAVRKVKRRRLAKCQAKRRRAQGWRASIKKRRRYAELRTARKVGARHACSMVEQRRQASRLRPGALAGQARCGQASGMARRPFQTTAQRDNLTTSLPARDSLTTHPTATTASPLIRQRRRPPVLSDGGGSAQISRSDENSKKPKRKHGKPHESETGVNEKP